MIISKNTSLEPGIYHLPEGVTIAADNVTLNGNGAVLVGNERKGVGVDIHKHSNISIKNLRILEYYHGISVRESTNLTITGCQISSTAELIPNTIFLDIFRSSEKPYGGGIFLWKVKESLIENNDLQHQMNGLLNYQCSQLTVRNNVANYCSGFGFHLHETCDSLFENNFADFCCRYEPRGRRQGHMGADSAGFLIVYNSSRNVFRGNLARLCGDGFFLSGLTHDLQACPCNDNLFEENDGSWSPNIAFEATFSQDNIFRNNIADYCNYGFWLGFSQGYTLENNKIRYNRKAGIAGENGIGMQALENDFRSNTHGILLWSKHIPEFKKAVPKNDTTRDWLIKGNLFLNNDKAIRVASNQDHGIRSYPSVGCPTPQNHVINKNRVEKNRIGFELIGIKDTILQENQMIDNAETDLVEKG